MNKNSISEFSNLVCLPWAFKLTEFNIFNQARHARYGYLILAPSIKIVSRILLIVACCLFYRILCKTVKPKPVHSFLILCGSRPRSGCNTLAPLWPDNIYSCNGFFLMAVINSNKEGWERLLVLFFPLVFQLYSIMFWYVGFHHFCFTAHEVEAF